MGRLPVPPLRTMDNFVLADANHTRPNELFDHPAPRIQMGSPSRTRVVLSERQALGGQSDIGRGAKACGAFVCRVGIHYPLHLDLLTSVQSRTDSSWDAADCERLASDGVHPSPWCVGIAVRR